MLTLLQSENTSFFFFSSLSYLGFIETYSTKVTFTSAFMLSQKVTNGLKKNKKKQTQTHVCIVHESNRMTRKCGFGIKLTVVPHREPAVLKRLAKKVRKTHRQQNSVSVKNSAAL